MIENEPKPSTLSRLVKKFERYIVLALIGMMMVVIALATLDLAWLIIVDIGTPPILLLEVDELLELFGFFLLIVIGVEVLETIKAYLRDNVIHIEIVLEVALIAIARKIIVLDLDKYDGVSVLAVAALILALAVASMLRRRARRPLPSTFANKASAAHIAVAPVPANDQHDPVSMPPFARLSARSSARSFTALRIIAPASSQSPRRFRLPVRQAGRPSSHGSQAAAPLGDRDA